MVEGQRPIEKPTTILKLEQMKLQKLECVNRHDINIF